MVNHQRRRWLRSYTEAPIWFAIKGSDVFFEGQLRNKSADGLCFSSEIRLGFQTELVVLVKPPGDADPAADTATAIVKWQSNPPGKDGSHYQTGIQFKSRPPANWV
jgi:hypothetical protein